MNEPQEIPEAREAANEIRQRTGFVLDCDLKEIISTSCREYAKRENADLLLALSRIQRANPDRTTATELQSQIAESAALRQQISALQEKNASLLEDISTLKHVLKIEEEKEKTAIKRLQEYHNEVMSAEQRVAELQKELKRSVCQECGGKGGVDSGGVTPWGSSIDIPCPSCSIDWRSRAEKAEMDNQELLKQLTVTLESNDHFQDLLEKAENELAEALHALRQIECSHHALREDVKPLVEIVGQFRTDVLRDFLSKHPELK
jgi:DNA repair exonuclease SbcCD ATPase subunit